MKKFAILGVFFQIQPGEPRTYSGICGNLWGSHHYKAGEVKMCVFSGFFTTKTDDDFDMFEGEITDEYGKASIIGTRVIGNIENLYFEKRYIGIKANPVNYELTKDGGIYQGHFSIEGAPRENNGWAKCTIVPIGEDFFSPDKFMEEIDAEKAKW